MQGLEQQGVLLRDEKDSGLRGIIRFSVNPTWVVVFEDLLFPRTENCEPPFYG